MSKEDLFKRHEQPDPLTKELQTLAREQKWTAPWDYEEQRRAAGKKGSQRRVTIGTVRLSMIKAAYSVLDPEYKLVEPKSKKSIEALKAKIHRLWGPCEAAPPPPPTDHQLDVLNATLTEMTGVNRECVLQDCLEDLYYDYHSRFPAERPDPLTKEESSAFLSVIEDWLSLSTTDVQNLTKMSVGTLQKGLQRLGVKGTRGRSRSV
jgi:hypothetical protein